MQLDGEAWRGSLVGLAIASVLLGGLIFFV
jgi:hypothetical protein